MIIGLTGGSGTGKSSACEFFEKKGYIIIDLDKVARSVCEKGSKCLYELCSVFGSDITDSEGNLTRKVLGDIVFENPEKLKLLNSVTHKYIMERTEKLICENRDKNIVLDAPLLFESGLDSFCDITAGILSEKEIRIKRIMQRDLISEKQACARIGSQPDDEFYISKCTYIFYNNGDIAALKLALSQKFGGANG